MPSNDEVVEYWETLGKQERELHARRAEIEQSIHRETLAKVWEVIFKWCGGGATEILMRGMFKELRDLFPGDCPE